MLFSGDRSEETQLEGLWWQLVVVTVFCSAARPHRIASMPQRVPLGCSWHGLGQARAPARPGENLKHSTGRLGQGTACTSVEQQLRGAVLYDGFGNASTVA